MANQIRHLTCQAKLEDPGEAEVWLRVVSEQQTPDNDVRGRITGPHCAFATTVEVAYPLRPFQRPPSGLQETARRVVIPEPSLWEPQCPFLYQVQVELWEAGQLCDQVQITLGMRTVSLGSRGLRLNGKSFTVRGMVRDQLSDGEALALRQADINTLLMPLTNECQELWQVADRLGFFILGLLENEDGLKKARQLAEHPSCLGWVLPETLKNEWQEGIARLDHGKSGPLVGVERNQIGNEPLAPGAHFVLCDESTFFSVEPMQIPKIIYLEKPWTDKLPPDCLGWVMKSSAT